MEEMIALANKENIIVEYFDFAEPIKGIYMVNDLLPPTIGLSCSLKDSYSLLRSIMGEELGHHFTTLEENIPKQFYNYSHRLNISKAEHEALEWAANYLIPDEDLKEALYDGIREIKYLAYYFNVTEEMIKVKFQYVDVNQLFLHPAE